MKRDSLRAQLLGKTYVITAAEVDRYRSEHAGQHRGGYPAGRKRTPREG